MDKPWKAICAFIGVFIAGAVFGGVFTLRASAKRQEELSASKQRLEAATTVPTPKVDANQSAANPTKANPPTPAQNSIVPRIMRQLTQRLNPTSDQREKIRTVVGRASDDIQRLQREHLQDTTRVMERMYEDVSVVLSADQRIQLEKMKQEMLERSRKEKEKQRLEPPFKEKAPRATSNASGQPIKSRQQQGP